MTSGGERAAIAFTILGSCRLARSRSDCLSHRRAAEAHPAIPTDGLAVALAVALGCRSRCRHVAEPIAPATTTWAPSRGRSRRGRPDAHALTVSSVESTPSLASHGQSLRLGLLGEVLLAVGPWPGPDMPQQSSHLRSLAPSPVEQMPPPSESPRVQRRDVRSPPFDKSPHAPSRSVLPRSWPNMPALGHYR